MITLYTFGPFFGLPDGSPFVMKGMLLLKMAGLDFKAQPTAPSKAPKGKLPFIDDAGVIVADTTFIRRHIEQKYGFDYDSGLTPEQKAIGWALEKLFEDHLYWLVMAERWMDDTNFAKGPARFFDSLPAPMRPVVRAMIRGKVRQALRGQGLYRHSPDERRDLARRDLEAAAALLGDKPFLFGDQPHGADATLGAFTLAALCPHFAGATRDEIEKLPNLAAYARRMEASYFPPRA
jgi:glutathione S-transferase